jgi:hypothetical protein
MSLTIRCGNRTYYFTPFSSTPPAPQQNENQQDFTFSSTIEAAAFLRGLGGYNVTGYVLRHVLRSAGVTSPTHYEEARVLKLVARELVRKRLTVLTRYRISESTSSNQEAETPALAPTPASRPGPKTLEPDPDTFADPDVDQQVGALMAASQTGVPFCQECERTQRQSA